jgi:Fasciclin domain
MNRILILASMAPIVLAIGVLEMARLPSMNTSRFAELVDSTGLRRRVDSLSTSFTVFLPTNDAMEVSYKC